MSETVELIRAYVEGYRGSRDVPAFEACVESEINERLAAKDKRISELEAMQKQMRAGCDGHCALDECVCEKDQRVIDLQVKAKELEEERLAQSERLRNLNTAMDTLIYQNSVLREAIRQVIEEGVQETTGPYSDKNNKCRHGKRGYEGCENCIIEHLQKALSLTPSEAAEMVRRKDEALAEAYGLLMCSTIEPDAAASVRKTIEAARAAGVEV